MKKSGVVSGFVFYLFFMGLTPVIHSNGQNLLHQNIDTVAFYEIETTKEKIAQLTAAGVVQYVRTVGLDKFIVQSNSRLDGWRVKKISGYHWKIFQKNWNPFERTTLSIGYTNLDLLKHHLENNRVTYSIVQDRKREQVLILNVESKRDREIVFQSPFVTSIDQANKESREETLVNYHDLSVNKVNKVHLNTPFNGHDLAISIKEKSFNTEDIDLKGRHFSYPLKSKEVSVHANFMATIAAGGGNNAPNSKGAAWNARISSSDFANRFADDADTLRKYGINAQNHSYGIPFGDPFENYYGEEAESYDLSVSDNPTILHVFSAGNSGALTNSEGVYAGLPSVSTLTGNYKMAKNVLVVGGHYKDYTIDNRNSRGPAFDGRIKPELVAYGEDGTSDAAAIATGVGVLIQDAYKASVGHAPLVSLLKASMIAGADDVGSEGIDHVTGYGAINAWKSVNLIELSQFVVDSVSPAQEKVFPIEIPSNKKKITVALVWSDPPATPGAEIALMNDLDLFITDPLAQKKLPWVLSSYPLMDSLTALPKRKADHLNNMEVVTIDNPASGTYQVHISSFELVTDKQVFAVAWSFQEQDDFSWTYPLPEETIEADQEVYLRWDNTLSGEGILEVSKGGGAWQIVNASVPLDKGFFVWRAPNENTDVKIRMTIASTIIETGPLVVSKQLNLKALYNCKDEGMIAWNKIPEATAYQIHSLGEQFLESVTIQTDTSFLINKEVISSEYLAVTPILDDQPAYRSLTYNINRMGVDCYYTLMNGLVNDHSIEVSLLLSTLYNVNQVVFEKLVDHTFVPIQTFAPVIDSELSYTDDDVKAGTNSYRAIIELQNGEESITDTIQVQYADQNTFWLWPNPVKAGEPLNFFTDGNNLSVHFYASDGRKMEEATLVGSYFTASVQTTLPPGMYFYQIFRGMVRVSSGKLVVVN